MKKLLSLIFLVATLLTASNLSAQSAIGQLRSLAGGTSVNIPFRRSANGAHSETMKSRPKKFATLHFHAKNSLKN